MPGWPPFTKCRDRVFSGYRTAGHRSLRSVAVPRRSTTGPAEQNPPETVRVALVHPRPLECSGIRTELRMLAGYRVELTVERGEELLVALGKGTVVDMALVYVAKSGTAGCSTLALLRDTWPRVGLVALGDQLDVELTERAYSAGALAILDLHATDPDGLRKAVTDVRGGQLHLNPVMVSMLRARGPKRPVKRKGPKVQLTRCEKLILYWMGHPSCPTQRGIAEKVDRGLSTVHSHIKKIYQKCGAHNHRAALRYAALNGLLDS